MVSSLARKLARESPSIAATAATGIFLHRQRSGSRLIPTTSRPQRR
jgi:hypothetical protein